MTPWKGNKTQHRKLNAMRTPLCDCVWSICVISSMAWWDIILHVKSSPGSYKAHQYQTQLHSQACGKYGKAAQSLIPFSGNQSCSRNWDCPFRGNSTLRQIVDATGTLIPTGVQIQTVPRQQNSVGSDPAHIWCPHYWKRWVPSKGNPMKGNSWQ